MICNLCPKKCGAEREATFGVGNCKMPSTLKIAHYELFMYEEPCISLKKGSGAIFFSGCNLDCVFCQNHKISHEGCGKLISVCDLVDIFKKLEEIGAENINLVSPMHYAMQIVEALKLYKPKVPVIYNTNAYESEEIISYVAKYVDVFLPDFKYHSNKLAKMFSGADDYFDVAIKSIKKMRELKVDRYDADGKILEGLIIRHMILPLCTDDSCDILKIIKQEIPNTKVSLMSQYFPCYRAGKFKQIDRKITKREYDKVLDFYIELGLDGYVQGLDSADDFFVPKFKYID